MGEVKRMTEILRTAKSWDITHADLVDHEFVIISVSEIQTRFGRRLLAVIEEDNSQKKVLIGSDVLIRQLDEVADMLPVSATIRKIKNYYTFA